MVFCLFMLPCDDLVTPGRNLPSPMLIHTWSLRSCDRYPIKQKIHSPALFHIIHLSVPLPRLLSLPSLPATRPICSECSYVLHLSTEAAEVLPVESSGVVENPDGPGRPAQIMADMSEITEWAGVVEAVRQNCEVVCRMGMR